MMNLRIWLSLLLLTTTAMREKLPLMPKTIVCQLNNTYLKETLIVHFFFKSPIVTGTKVDLSAARSETRKGVLLATHNEINKNIFFIPDCVRGPDCVGQIKQRPLDEEWGQGDSLRAEPCALFPRTRLLRPEIEEHLFHLLDVNGVQWPESRNVGLSFTEASDGRNWTMDQLLSANQFNRMWLMCMPRTILLAYRKSQDRPRMVTMAPDLGTGASSDRPLSELVRRNLKSLHGLKHLPLIRFKLFDFKSDDVEEMNKCYYFGTKKKRDLCGDSCGKEKLCSWNIGFDKNTNWAGALNGDPWMRSASCVCRRNDVHCRVDECATRSHDCAPGTTCIDRAQGFKCTRETVLPLHRSIRSAEGTDQPTLVVMNEDDDNEEEKEEESIEKEEEKNKTKTDNHECDPGFEITVDAKCVDINECERGLDDCDKTTTRCVNVPGSFECPCIDSARLRADARSCRQSHYEFRILDPTKIACCKTFENGPTQTLTSSTFLVRGEVFNGDAAYSSFSDVVSMGCLRIRSHPLAHESDKIMQLKLLTSRTNVREEHLELETLSEFLVAMQRAENIAFLRKQRDETIKEGLELFTDLVLSSNASCGLRLTGSRFDPKDFEETAQADPKTVLVRSAKVFLTLDKSVTDYTDFEQIGGHSCNNLSTNPLWLIEKMSSPPAKNSALYRQIQCMVNSTSATTSSSSPSPSSFRNGRILSEMYILILSLTSMLFNLHLNRFL